MDEPGCERPPGPDGELSRRRHPRDEPRESDGPGPGSAGRHRGRISDPRCCIAAEDLLASPAGRGAAIERRRLRDPPAEKQEERGGGSERRATREWLLPPAR